MLDRTCVECGATLTGKQTRFCSRTCSNVAQARARTADGRRRTAEAKAERRANRQSEYHLRTCIVCGAEWRTQRKDGKYCTDACKGQHYSEIRRVRPLCSPITIIECGDGCGALRVFKGRARKRWTCGCRPAFTAGWCSRCGSSFVLAWNDLPAAYCSRHCRTADAKARRRAARRGGYVAPVNRTAVFERDGWKCQLCGFDIDRRAVVPDLEAGVIDHVVPLARGGTHEPANVQAAHFWCNSYKRDTTAA